MTTAVGVGQPSVPFNEADGVIEAAVAPVPVANAVVAFTGTPVNNGMVMLTKGVGDALITPVPATTVKFPETASMDIASAVKRGTGAEAVPTGALELTGMGTKPCDGTTPVDRGMDNGPEAVPSGALEFKATGGAVPVGRNAVELAGVIDLENEPRRGLSVFEKSSIEKGAVPMGAVPLGAVTSGPEVILADCIGTELGPVARSEEFTETVGAAEDPKGLFADWTGTMEDPVAPDNCVLFKATPVLRGMGTPVTGAVPGNEAFAVGIGAVPDKVTLLVTSGCALGMLEVRDLKCPNRSPSEFEKSGPVLPLAVGKAALELTDSGGRVTEAATKGCSVPLLAVLVRFRGTGGRPPEGCSTLPLAVGKTALEFTESSEKEAEGCSTLPLAVGRATVRFAAVSYTHLTLPTKRIV